MKIKLYTYICLVGLLSICLSSCDLARDLESFNPNFALDADEAIVNEASAELALIGVYSGFRQRSSGSGNPEIYLIPSLMSGVLTNTLFNTGQEALGFINNEPIPVNASTSLGAYARMYDIINRCNWLIEKVSPLPEDVFVTPGRKTQIIAEAKAVRATANFYLLRLFGQFYDVGSKYGITLRLEPARSSEAFPRNTVGEVYDAILSDLDEAIADAPDLRTRFFTNKTYAKGLKAKVMLYKGDYQQAAMLAKEVIDGTGDTFRLATDYAGIFQGQTPSLFESPEVIFGSKGEPQGGLGIGNFIGGYWAAIDPSYLADAQVSTTIGTQSIDLDGGRIPSLTFDNNGTLDTYKYSDAASGQLYEMIYHLRMSEVYLIYAEANARSNNSVTQDALDALNAIRIRAGATSTGGDGFETYPATISYEQFLEAVRKEKWAELGLETGEEWYDLVRYHFVDGFDVTKVKSTATNPNKYILPIDVVNIESGGNVVEQNPGY
ncbi:RagB/SusD family nutrient uptake outer membrane protein [Belliella marina]|uniref:RagB/SusD family nutrient uptake outer membrane protein n=1 Tax=Belliella marina TaxID=1644146 RepID=A0ABW4VQD8_9BACT